jgi:hypothetical protein
VPVKLKLNDDERFVKFARGSELTGGGRQEEQDQGSRRDLAAGLELRLQG